VDQFGWSKFRNDNPSQQIKGQPVSIGFMDSVCALAYLRFQELVASVRHARSLRRAEGGPISDVIGVA
jgi:hypothetical protein